MRVNAIGDVLRDLTKILDCFVNEPLPFDIKRDEMLTMDEVCARLKITRVTLSAWMKAGKFPEALTIAGTKRWPTSLINSRIYEDNPQLRERENLMAQARKVSHLEHPKTQEELDHERLVAEARRIATSEKSGATA